MLLRSLEANSLHNEVDLGRPRGTSWQCQSRTAIRLSVMSSVGCGSVYRVCVGYGVWCTVCGVY